MKTYGNSNRRMAQKQRRESLLQEGLAGITVKETLPNTWFPWTKEAEAMYFKNARDFLKTSLAYNILNEHQDMAGEIACLRGKVK